jgi:hypothetical protein
MAAVTKPLPWVVVERAGTDDEAEVRSLATLFSAIKFQTKMAKRGEDFSVMKRLPDGALTTEF